MVKKIKKILYIFLAVIMCVCVLTACTDYTYKSFEDGNITGGYNKHDAFVGACFWDGGDKYIEIPDEYNGVPVTLLGGSTGIGAPSPFQIILRDREYITYANADENLHDDQYETVIFTVKIGKNIYDIKYVLGKTFLGIKTYDENGDELIDIVYKVLYYFEVDSENETYYSKDGKLYYKSSDILENRFYYE